VWWAQVGNLCYGVLSEVAQVGNLCFGVLFEVAQVFNLWHESQVCRISSTPEA
jgi:hypothetical protein